MGDVAGKLIDDSVDGGNVGKLVGRRLGGKVATVVNGETVPTFRSDTKSNRSCALWFGNVLARS